MQYSNPDKFGLNICALQAGICVQEKFIQHKAIVTMCPVNGIVYRVKIVLKIEQVDHAARHEHALSDKVYE
jgi:hypothetical protein